MDPSPPASPSRSRRRLWLRAGLAIVLVGALVGWRYWMTRPAHRYDRARAAIALKDWDAALWQAERLESAGRNDLEILIRAEVLIQRGDPGGALERLAKFPETGDRSEAAVMVARCLMSLNRPREAAEAFALAMRLKPDHVEAYRGAAQIAYNVGQLDTAVVLLERLLELDPHDGKPARLLGDIQADMGRYEAAAVAYETALARPLDADLRDATYRAWATVLGSGRRYEEMLSVCDDVRKRGIPVDVEWSALRGEALRGSGKLAEAREHVEAALRAYPGSPPHLSLFAQLELDDGRAESAVTALESAVSQTPQVYPLVLLLSQAYTAAGRKSDAEKMGERAEKLRTDLDIITTLTKESDKRPWDAALRRELADVCERMGNAEMAAKWRETAKMLGK
jgi:tetratricopeptide (TPR) repeat protein